MTSSRPYILRALYEWILDNRMTPYIIVNTSSPEVQVPKQFINNGKIVFNISPDAILDLFISNLDLEFDASFSGMPHHIIAPINSIQAIYAQENGEGMFFGDEPGGETPPDDTKHMNPKKKVAKKSHLSVVK